MSALLLSLLVASAPAAELAGVTMPDTVTVGQAQLKLNGLGLREFLWIDIYVGGLYLPTKTSDATQAIEKDVPKRVVMHFIRDVGRDRMVKVFREGIEEQGGMAALGDRLVQLEGMIDRDAVAGDRVILDYVPGKGLTLTFGGTAKGTIPGADFMRGIWTIFLGDKPASAKLKKGMLGG
jgi:hypothetical protein